MCKNSLSFFIFSDIWYYGWSLNSPWAYHVWILGVIWRGFRAFGTGGLAGWGSHWGLGLWGRQPAVFLVLSLRPGLCRCEEALMQLMVLYLPCYVEMNPLKSSATGIFPVLPEVAFSQLWKKAAKTSRMSNLNHNQNKTGCSLVFPLDR